MRILALIAGVVGAGGLAGIGGLAASAQQPPAPALPSSSSSSSPSPCAFATRLGLEASAGEFCAGEEAQRLASAAKAEPERLRQLGRAADHYRRAAAVSTRPDAQVLAFTLLADCYDAQHLNDPARMEAALREVIRLAPGDAAPVARLALLQEERGLIDAAEDTLLTTRRQHPDSVDLYKLLAQFYARRVTAMTKPAVTEAVAKSGPGEPDAEGVYRVGGSLSPPARLDVPQYPPDARAAGIKGAVLADVVIDERGRVTEARIVRSIPLLDDAALAAVRNWQFAPTLVNGAPVPIRMTVTVNFTTR
jgi:TonB family protein